MKTMVLSLLIVDEFNHVAEGSIFFFSGGVAIDLSPDAEKSRCAANLEFLHFGRLILAIKMLLRDTKNDSEW